MAACRIGIPSPVADFVLGLAHLILSVVAPGDQITEEANSSPIGAPKPGRTIPAFVNEFLVLALI